MEMKPEYGYDSEYEHRLLDDPVENMPWYGFIFLYAFVIFVCIPMKVWGYVGEMWGNCWGTTYYVRRTPKPCNVLISWED